MTGEGGGLQENWLLHHHPVPFTSDRSFPKGHVPQECQLLNVSPLLRLLDIVTFSNRLLLALRGTAAWRWLTATDFWTHFTRYKSRSLLSVSVCLWLGVHSTVWPCFQFIWASCLSLSLWVASCVLLSQCISLCFTDPTPQPVEQWRWPAQWKNINKAHEEGFCLQLLSSLMERKGCCTLEEPPNLILEKPMYQNARQSSDHIAWVDTVLWKALNKVLSDPYSLLHVLFFFPLPISYMLVPNFAEWRDSCRLSHSPLLLFIPLILLPSSSSAHILILLLC